MPAGPRRARRQLRTTAFMAASQRFPFLHTVFKLADYGHEDSAADCGTPWRAALRSGAYRPAKMIDTHHDERRSAMKRAQLNFAVDAVIAVAFLITAVSGILFLLPSGAVRELGLGRPGMLGVSYATWRHLHDWSGVVAVAGVLVHAALHYRWIVTMTRRTFAPAPVASRPAAGARPTAGANAGAERPAGATAAQSRAGGRGRNDARRFTRRGFVVGAATGLGAILLGGGLLDRLGVLTTGGTANGATNGSAIGTNGTSGATGSGGTTGATGASGTGGSTSATGTSGASGTSGTSTGASSAQTTSPTPAATPNSTGTTAALVAVDESSCTGCGRCLEVCPADVFSWDQSGRRSEAARPAQCVRCRRCVGVCPASAITLAA